MVLVVLATVVSSASNLLKNGNLEGKDVSEFTVELTNNVKCSIIEEPDGNRCAKLELIQYQMMGEKKVANGALLIGGARGNDGQDGSKALRVKPNTTYEFSFDVKGTIGLLRRTRMFVWPEKGGGYFQGREQIDTFLDTIELTQQWVRYQGEVTTNGTAHKACLRLPIYYEGDVPELGSYLLVDNVVIKEKVEVFDPSEGFKVGSIDINSFPLSIISTVNTIGYYSPETGLKTAHRLSMISRPTTFKNTVGLHIYWLIDSSRTGFDSWEERKPKPYLVNGNGTINLDGPLFPGLKPIKVSLGRVYINYSPYVATINYDYAKMAHGISVNNVVWQNVNCSGFFVWENDRAKSFSLLGEGLRLRTNNRSWNGEMILVRHRVGPPKFNYGMLPDFGVTREFSQQLTLNYRINPKTSIEGLWIDKYSYLDSTTTKVNAHKINLKSKNLLPNLDLSYWNFDENFDPRYRSTHPEFLYFEENQRVGLNPIDLYKNQQGYNLDLSGSHKKVNMGLSLKRFRHVNKQEPFSSNLKGILENPKHKLTLLLSLDQENSFRYQEYAWQMLLAKDQAKTIKGNLVYLHDLTKYNNDLFSSEPIGELSMEIDLKKGLIPGLNLRGGLQCATKNHWYLRTKFKLLNNLEVRVFWRSNNVVEQLDQLPPESNMYVSNDGTFWCDEFNRIHYPDNHIRIQSRVSF